MTRLCFFARDGHTFLGERARGLAREMGPDVLVSYQYADTAGPIGAVRCFLKLLVEARRHDAMWLISQHPARVLAASVARRLFGTRLIVDTADLLYESARTAGTNRLVCSAVREWERFTWHAGDVIVVHGTHHKRLLESQGVRSVEFVADGVDTEQFSRRDEAALRRELGLADQVSLGVVGTIGWAPALGLPSPGWDLIECLARLPDLPVRGVVIGDGPGFPRLKRLCIERGLEKRMLFVGKVPYKELPRYLSVIDICLHTALNNEMSWARTTGKLPLILAAGCVLIASAVGEAAYVLRDTGMLLPFDGSPQQYAASLADRVRACVLQSDLREELAGQGPAIARRFFDYAVLSRHAADIVETLAAGERRRPMEGIRQA